MHRISLELNTHSDINDDYVFYTYAFTIPSGKHLKIHDLNIYVLLQLQTHKRTNLQTTFVFAKYGIENIFIWKEVHRSGYMKPKKFFNSYKRSFCFFVVFTYQVRRLVEGVRGVVRVTTKCHIWFLCQDSLWRIGRSLGIVIFVNLDTCLNNTVLV